MFTIPSADPHPGALLATRRDPGAHRAGLSVASLLVGSGNIPPQDTVRYLLAGDGSLNSVLVRDFRVPRTLLAIAVGAALGLSGTIIQALTRNPLADPGILGVNAGAYSAVVFAAAWLGSSLTGAHVFFALGGYDYEAIQALNPDLILNTRSGADEEQFNRLSSIAPTVYAPAGTANYGTAWDTQILQVSTALGLPDEGAALVSDIEQSITDAAAAHPEFDGVTAVTGTKFGDQYGAYIAGDFRWDLLASLGFVQNPPVLELAPTGFYVALSAEQIGALDAEVAVFFPIGFTLEEMKADPLVGSLAVVQEDRTVWMEDGAELTQAFSAASPLSIPIVVEGLTDQLAAIVG